MAQLGLKTDDVVKRAKLIVLAQLDHRVRFIGTMRIGQADRFERAMAQSFRLARGHHLDRHAALEIGRVLFPILELDFVAGQQGLDEGGVLRLIQGAIDVTGAVAIGVGLVIARLKPGFGEVDVAVNDGRDGVKKSQRVLTG